MRSSANRRSRGHPGLPVTTISIGWASNAVPCFGLCHGLLFLEVNLKRDTSEASGSGRSTWKASLLVYLGGQWCTVLLSIDKLH